MGNIKTHITGMENKPNQGNLIISPSLIANEFNKYFLWRFFSLHKMMSWHHPPPFSSLPSQLCMSHETPAFNPPPSVLKDDMKKSEVHTTGIQGLRFIYLFFSGYKTKQCILVSLRHQLFKLYFLSWNYIIKYKHKHIRI